MALDRLPRQQDAYSRSTKGLRGLKKQDMKLEGGVVGESLGAGGGKAGNRDDLYILHLCYESLRSKF